MIIAFLLFGIIIITTEPGVGEGGPNDFWKKKKEIKTFEIQKKHISVTRQRCVVGHDVLHAIYGTRRDKIS